MYNCYTEMPVQGKVLQVQRNTCPREGITTTQKYLSKARYNNYTEIPVQGKV